MIRIKVSGMTCGHCEGAVRKAMNSPPWSAVAPGEASGQLVHCSRLASLAGADRPLILLLDAAEGDEEIPPQVVGILLRQPIPHLRRLLVGLAFVVLGLAFFLMGLEMVLFPLGERMAMRLSSPEFLIGTVAATDAPGWWQYAWVYLFAAIIGFTATLAEPSLIAVAMKANQASRGTIRPWGLRLVVAIGVAAGASAQQVADPGFDSIGRGAPLEHDANDYEVGLRQSLTMINILRPDGTLNENAGPYCGQSVMQSRENVVADLEKEFGRRPPAVLTVRLP